MTSISPVEVEVPAQLSIPTTSSNRFERLEIEGGNLVVDLDYAATSCDHNHGEASKQPGENKKKKAKKKSSGKRKVKGTEPLKLRLSPLL